MSSFIVLDTALVISFERLSELYLSLEFIYLNPGYLPFVILIYLFFL